MLFSVHSVLGHWKDACCQKGCFSICPHKLCMPVSSHNTWLHVHSPCNGHSLAAILDLLQKQNPNVSISIILAEVACLLKYCRQPLSYAFVPLCVWIYSIFWEENPTGVFHTEQFLWGKPNCFISFTFIHQTQHSISSAGLNADLVSQYW